MYLQDELAIQHNSQEYSQKITDYHTISNLSIWDKVPQALIDAEMVTHPTSCDFLLDEQYSSHFTKSTPEMLTAISESVF